jgi:glycosyltransferase involved in cell wall biosynthesis
MYLKNKDIKNVFLLGNQADIFYYLYESDLFLSTSLYEGHPISILEAMSIGLPIVASKVTGNVDTIKNEISGFFYRLGDIKKASFYIEKIMKNNALKLQLSNNAFFTHRKLFTTSKMKKSYISLYKKYY